MVKPHKRDCNDILHQIMRDNAALNRYHTFFSPSFVDPLAVNEC